MKNKLQGILLRKETGHRAGRVVGLLLLLAAISGCSLGGNQTKDQTPVTGTASGAASQSEAVTLTLAAPWSASIALEHAAEAFHRKYPNCKIEYEFLQNYEESLLKRLENAPETVDLFLSNNIQETSPVYPYAKDLMSCKELDLSHANRALIRNFTLAGTADKAPELYSVPLGGELRGLYVNRTLLQTLNLEIPKNREELLQACEVLKEHGYIPLHGNPGMFGQRLLYPYVCSLIAHAEDYEGTYEAIETCEPGVSQLFKEPMSLLYTITEKGYYNYKKVETEYEMFLDTSDEGSARYFFNVLGPEGDYRKQDDVGTVAFMPGTLTQKTTMEKIRSDYHSTIDYEFILTPVDDGGYAYLSPARGISINKNSRHTDLAALFLNFLFEPEEAAAFAEEMNYIPNQEDSFAFVSELFGVSDDRITDLGKVTFGYSFYDVINNTITDISKGNNPKYMDQDKRGNPVMYDFDHYMEELEAAFAANRKDGN